MDGGRARGRARIQIGKVYMQEIREEQIKSAYLVGLRTGQSEERFFGSMEELKSLAQAAGYEVLAIYTQNQPEIHKATYIGEGKVREVAEGLGSLPADAVIFDDTLSPMQIRNLGKELETVILDRTGLILEIFSERARTREAKLQVESAQLQYLLPRLAGMRQNLDRQGGNSGSRSSRGAGEKQIELDRRHIEHRISVLRRELVQVRRERETQRSRRLGNGEFRVALVGYTNAGKSTLLNLLLQSFRKDRAEDKSVLEKDMLFATLDTTIRRIEPPGMQAFLLSDTVGFISELPTTLVDAFRSTLEEAVYADLLLQVVDYSDEDHAFQEEVTRETLREIGAGAIPCITVYNKMDKYEAAQRAGRSADEQVLLFPEYPSARADKVYVTLKGEHAQESVRLLLEQIDRMRSQGEEEHTYRFPYDKTAELHAMKRLGQVLSERYEADGTEVKMRVRPAVGKAYAAYEVT